MSATAHPAEDRDDAAAAHLEQAAPDRYAVRGALTFDTVPFVLAAGCTAIATQRSLSFDLAGVSRADSAGLALLIEWLRVARRCDAHIVFLHVPEQLAAIAVACRVDDLLENEARPSA